MPPRKKQPKQYINPPKNDPILDGQLPLIPLPPGLDTWNEFGTAQVASQRLTSTRLDQYEREANSIISAIRQSRALLSRGIQLPNVARAVGVTAVEYESAYTEKTWVLRPNSNMAIVADMLEAAGTKGVTEKQMVSELYRRGRLETARYPRKAVRWTVRELRRRTSWVVAKTDDDGRTLWYAYGPFDAWKPTAAQKSEDAKLDQ